MLSQLISGHDSLQEPTSELLFKKFRIVLIKPSKYDARKWLENPIKALSWKIPRLRGTD